VSRLRSHIFPPMDYVKRSMTGGRQQGSTWHTLAERTEISDHARGGIFVDYDVRSSQTTASHMERT
jgi:hypothetical protein